MAHSAGSGLASTGPRTGTSGSNSWAIVPPPLPKSRAPPSCRAVGFNREKKSSSTTAWHLYPYPARAQHWSGPVASSATAVHRIEDERKGGGGEREVISNDIESVREGHVQYLLRTSPLIHVCWSHHINTCTSKIKIPIILNKPALPWHGSRRGGTRSAVQIAPTAIPRSREF